MDVEYGARHGIDLKIFQAIIYLTRSLALFEVVNLELLICTTDTACANSATAAALLADSLLALSRDVKSGCEQFEHRAHHDAIHTVVCGE